MLNRKKVLALCVAGGLAIFQCASVYAATINSVSGTVQVRKGGGQKKTTAASNMSVAKGDIICTGAGSSATVTIDGGKKVTLGANTTIYVKNLNTVSQTKGSTVTTGSGKNYSTQVPTAIMGVKGTTYGVQQKENETYVTLPEGALEITNNTGVITQLNANQQINLNSTKNTLNELNIGQLNYFTFNEFYKMRNKFNDKVRTKLETAEKPQKESDLENGIVDAGNTINYNISKSKKKSRRGSSGSSGGSTSVVSESEYYKIIDPIDGYPSIRLKSNTKGKEVSFTFDNSTGQEVTDLIVRNSEGGFDDWWQDGEKFKCLSDGENTRVSFVMTTPDAVKIIY